MYKLKRYVIEGLTLEVYTHECVYEPSDDSFLGVRLLKAISEKGYNFSNIIDIGTGTGILALAAQKLFNPVILVAVDINPYAVEAASKTLGSGSLVIRCDSIKCIDDRHLWDLAIVNPPYLPLNGDLEHEECMGFLKASWSGARVFKRLIIEVASHAESLLVVYSSLSPSNASSDLEKLGFKVKYSLREGFFMETVIAVFAERDEGSWIS